MFSFIDGIHRRAYRLYILFLAWLSKPERVRKTAELLANKKRRVLWHTSQGVRNEGNLP